MSSDDDFDVRGGGLGFTGTGRRKKRRGLGDEDNDDVLGVFAYGGDSDEEPDGRRGRKGKGKGKGRPDGPLAPVSFLKSAAHSIDPAKKVTVSELGEKKSSKDAQEDEDEIDPRFTLNAATNLPKPVEGPKLPAKNKMSMRQMEKDYGKGFAMLQKMGFTGGGLGKHEDGIANPIEVRVRKHGEALQEEGEMLDQDLYGLEPGGGRKSVEELLTAKMPKDTRATDGWKKNDSRSGAKRPRTTYKTAAEVAADRRGEPHTMRIVDMRGVDGPRVLSSFSEIASTMGGESVKSLKEFRHNARLLVTKCEQKILAFTEKKRYFEEILLASARDLDQIDAVSAFTSENMRCCRKIVKQVEDLRERQDSGLIDLEELGAAFVKLRTESSAEFKALGLLETAVSLGTPLAKKELGSWEPLKDPEKVILLLKPWRRLVNGESSRAVEQLCNAAVLPRLRASLCDWSPRDFEPCIRLFAACKEALPPETIEALAAQVIVPRLAVELEEWEPRKDRLAAHLWIHPWLPVLGDRLRCLWPSVRLKLAASLELWEPSEPAGHELLRPWRTVLAAEDWEPLIEKVLLKLAASLGNLAVRPNGQDTGPVQHLLAWLDTVPVERLARILETTFFPRWQSALRSWLKSPGCDCDEVVEWYESWRELLPETVREQGGIQRQLQSGLEVMKFFMSGAADEEGASLDEDVPPPPTRESSAASVGRTASTGSLGRAESVSDAVGLSLADYLGEVAGEHGILFRPKAKVEHLGKQVYQFGNASIYLDKTVVFAGPRGGGEGSWRPVSLDEVLKLAKAELPKHKSTRGTR